jgi:hypothetical protein
MPHVETLLHRRDFVSRISSESDTTAAFWNHQVTAADFAGAHWSLGRCRSTLMQDWGYFVSAGSGLRSPRKQRALEIRRRHGLPRRNNELLARVLKKSLESLITPVTGSPRACRSTLNSMFSTKWLQQHEVLAAVVFVSLSIALTGFFAWLERRFFRQ